MFEGSEHHDSGYFQPLQSAGALLNGSTNADRTNYWEVVPTGAVELALWLESDRMGYLLPAADAPSGQLGFTDAVLQADSQFDAVFPYLRTPQPGATQ